MKVQKESTTQSDGPKMVNTRNGITRVQAHKQVTITIEVSKCECDIKMGPTPSTTFLNPFESFLFISNRTNQINRQNPAHHET